MNVSSGKKLVINLGKLQSRCCIWKDLKNGNKLKSWHTWMTILPTITKLKEIKRTDMYIMINTLWFIRRSSREIVDLHWNFTQRISIAQLSSEVELWINSMVRRPSMKRSSDKALSSSSSKETVVNQQLIKNEWTIQALHQKMSKIEEVFREQEWVWPPNNPSYVTVVMIMLVMITLRMRREVSCNTLSTTAEVEIRSSLHTQIITLILKISTMHKWSAQPSKASRSNL